MSLLKRVKRIERFIALIPIDTEENRNNIFIKKRLDLSKLSREEKTFIDNIIAKTGRNNGSIDLSIISNKELSMLGEIVLRQKEDITNEPEAEDKEN